MKIFLITNLFPKVSNPNSGIFIVQRLKHYRTYDVNFDAVSPTYENSKLVNSLKKFLRKQEEYPSAEHEGVKFKPVLINRNLRMVLMNKISRSYFVKIADQFAKAIERSFDLREYDLIHAHGMYSVPAGLTAKILAEKYEKPFVVTLHGSDVNLLMPRRKEIYVNVLERHQPPYSSAEHFLNEQNLWDFPAKTLL